MTIRSILCRRDYIPQPTKKYPWTGVWQQALDDEYGPDDRVGLVVLFINEREAIPVYIPRACQITVSVGQGGGNFHEDFFVPFKGKIEMIFE